MRLDVLGRVVGSMLVVTAYFIILHVSASLGAGLQLIGDAITVPYFVRTQSWDVVIMLGFLLVISLSKLAL